MEDSDKNLSTKIAHFEKRKNATVSIAEKNLPTKEGFPFLVMQKDSNGFNFNPKHLLDYSLGNKYTITIANSNGKKTLLYNYFVDNENLKLFFTLCAEGKIEGDIIEIDKFNPEILA